MNEFAVKNIEPDSFFSNIVYLDKAFVVAAPEMNFNKDLIDILCSWNYKNVFCDGEPGKEYMNEAENGSLSVDISMQSDSEKLEKAERFYMDFLFFVEKLFIKATISSELEYKFVSEKIKDIVEYVKEDRRFLMRIIKKLEPEPEKNYLAAHSVRSTILAIIIGTYLKLPNHRLIELGVASILHEAGMLKLPSQLYLSNRPLGEKEQKAIISHPLLGYTMLKSFDFPLSVCLAALEHHERENGSGYPRNLSGDKISLYAKIIAVACSYEALSSKRPHKEAKDGFTGMLELLKNEGKKYDDNIVKALVNSLSIYPIGLYVLLSNDKKGQVVDVNPENPRFPVVQIFGELSPDGKIKTMQTAPDVLTIVRPLTRAEIEG